MTLWKPYFSSKFTTMLTAVITVLDSVFLKASKWLKLLLPNAHSWKPTPVLRSFPYLTYNPKRQIHVVVRMGSWSQNWYQAA